MEGSILDNPMAVSLDEALKIWRDDKCTTEEFTEYLDANEEASLEMFRRWFITDPEGIVKVIQTQRGIWQGVKEDGCVHTPQYFDRLLSMLDRFEEEVEGAYLIEELPAWWGYSVTVDTSGITLHMDYYSDPDARLFLAFQSDEDQYIMPDQTFDLIKVESKLLKVEDYAATFGVDPSAVRAWIRRGKLPAALKYGREWRIPELCDVGGRTYTQRTYRWHEELTDLPEEYSYLNDYFEVILRRNPQDKKCYVADFVSSNIRNSVRKKLSIKEREHLEMVLISNPMVHLESQPFAFITMRSGQGVYLEPFDGFDDNKLLRKKAKPKESQIKQNGAK